MASHGRKNTKLLRQRAAMDVLLQPEAAEIAKAIRARTQAVLRSPHRKEQPRRGRW